RRWHLERARQLGDGHELRDPHQRLLALALFAPPLLLHLTERRPLLAAVHALLADRRLQRGEGARNVLRHRFLIDQRFLALLALLALFAAPVIERRRARGGRCDGPRWHATAPARPPPGWRATRHWAWTHGRGDERARGRRSRAPGARSRLGRLRRRRPRRPRHRPRRLPRRCGAAAWDGCRPRPRAPAPARRSWPRRGAASAARSAAFVCACRAPSARAPATPARP